MEIKNVHCEKQALELFRMMPDSIKHFELAKED